MSAEIICVGTELLRGKVNTNCAYLGERMSSLGIEVSYIVTVGDDKELLSDLFQRALSRSRIVVVTGGLGPTFDDITREAVSQAMGLKLVTHKEILETIKLFFAKRNIVMPPDNAKQAQIIEGGEAIINQHGTAPGQCIRWNSDGNERILFLLPGPPREMQPMFDAYVYPYLKKKQTAIKKSVTVRIFGLSESAVDEKIRPVVDAERELDKGLVDFCILAHQMIVDITVTATGEDELAIDGMLHNIEQELKDILGSSIFGRNHDTLESVVGNLLISHKATLSVAESCTGGLLAQKITNIPGSSVYFKEGMITYSNESKTELLNIPREVIETNGAVSEQTARAMVRGLRAFSKTNFAISLTGIAGPSGSTDTKPVGLVYIGLSGPYGEMVEQYQFMGTRSDIRERAANTALNMLRLELTAHLQGQQSARGGAARRKK